MCAYMVAYNNYVMCTCVQRCLLFKLLSEYALCMSKLITCHVSRQSLCSSHSVSTQYHQKLLNIHQHCSSHFERLSAIVKLYC